MLPEYFIPSFFKQSSEKIRLEKRILDHLGFFENKMEIRIDDIFKKETHPILNEVMSDLTSRGFGVSIKHVYRFVDDDYFHEDILLVIKIE